MSLKETLMLGAAGAAAIYVARKIPAVETVFDKGATSNGKTVPLIPQGFMARHEWSLAFTLIPAFGAWYLSR